MSIRIQIDDAIYLKESERYLGALTILMLSVAASSRKVFPKGTKSISNPEKDMKDGEAFSSFLGGRIRKLLFGDLGGPAYGSSGITIEFKGKPYDLAFLLYKYYRCELIHNGELPEDIEFVKAESNRVGGMRVTLGTGNKMVLDTDWIPLLIEAVVGAECNAKLFGRVLYHLVPRENFNEDTFSQELIEKFDVSIGRYEILKHAVLLMDPDEIIFCQTSEVNALFKNKVISGMPKNGLNSGAITGLSSREVTDLKGNLLDKGVQILLLISKMFKREEK